jgi:3-oxoacyl-[acyl-carrier protein] reductase
VRVDEKSLAVDLHGETALVTGGSRNIGLAIAKTLRAAGARLCIVGLSDQKALDRAVERLDPNGREAMGMLVHVADEAAVMNAFERIESKLGPVSILVNGAAHRPHEPFTSISKKAWSEVLDVILTGAFLTSREMFRRLPEERLGAIVNIGGLSAHRPAKDRPHVIAAKSGLEGLTRALAEEGLGRIRANCIVPGAIETARAAGQVAPRFAGDQDRLRGAPEDIARAVLPLSDPRQTYFTGQTLHVNGGRFMS